MDSSVVYFNLQILLRYWNQKTLTFSIKNNKLRKNLFFKTEKNILFNFIKSQVNLLNQNHAWLIQNHQLTDLGMVAQKFNQLLKNKVPLFQEIGLSNNEFIILNEILPFQIQAKKISTELSEIQKPYVINKNGKKLYFYNELDCQCNHKIEATRIFFDTQWERVKSGIGYCLEIFGIKIFKKIHYFQSKQNIYSHDSILGKISDLTFFWVGHATCLLNIPLNKTSSIHLITDPIEGAITRTIYPRDPCKKNFYISILEAIEWGINNLLYPRLTKPGAKMEEWPLVHICTLSHNHLDHFDAKTLKKLLPYKPLFIVAEGDKHWLEKLGCEKQNIIELSWWEKVEVSILVGQKSLKMDITATPTRHWSGQGGGTAYQATTLGYIYKTPEIDDIYFSGDTARLDAVHLNKLLSNFNIQTLFQPGGPDEVRYYMQSTHQAAVDAIWMYMEICLKKIYERSDTKVQFLKKIEKQKVLFMHHQTYKLGNIHFDDTQKGLERLLEAIENDTSQFLKSYEKQVFDEVKTFFSNLLFNDGCFTQREIVHLLKQKLIIPKIGSKTYL